MLRGSDWLTNCAYSVNGQLTARCSVKLFVIKRSGLLGASAAHGAIALPTAAQHLVDSQGQSSDKTVASMLLEGPKPQRDLIADRGYDARAIIDWVESRVPAINSVYDAGQSLRTQRKRV
jgi:hypothetical protein